MNDPITGFSIGASFPLFGITAARNKVRAAQAEVKVQEEALRYNRQQLQTDQSIALAELEKNKALLKFYETSGLRQADEIIKAATLSYNTGEIAFAELSQFLGQAIGIRQNHLDVLNLYNKSAIQINYLTNK